MGIGVPGHLHPLGNDLLAGLREAAVLLGELGGQGKDGMGYALVIGVGVRNAPPGQKFPVHVFPDAVGVDQRPVHVKQQHGPPPFLGEEPGLAISAPLC